MLSHVITNASNINMVFYNSVWIKKNREWVYAAVLVLIEDFYRVQSYNLFGFLGFS